MLAKQKEAGKVLIAEDEEWLNGGEEDESTADLEAHFSLMAYSDESSSNASDFTPKVSNSDYDKFMIQMTEMMNQLSDFQTKLKVEKQLVSKLEKRLEKNYNELVKANTEIATYQNIALNAQTDMEVFQQKNIELKEELSILTEKNLDLSNELVETNQKLEFSKLQRTDLLEKLNKLEVKLHKIGQSEQTIFLNTPKEIGCKAGLGSNNPQFLAKAINQTPTLYKFEYLGLGPDHAVKFIKPTPKDNRREFWKRHNKNNAQIPFCYPTEVEQDFSKPFLQNDYFPCYIEDELQVTPPTYKPYIPTLYLEEKIIFLKNN